MCRVCGEHVHMIVRGVPEGRPQAAEGLGSLGRDGPGRVLYAGGWAYRRAGRQDIGKASRFTLKLFYRKTKRAQETSSSWLSL